LTWSTLARIEQLFAQGAREPGSTRAREQIGRAQRDRTCGLVETWRVGACVDHVLAQSTREAQRTNASEGRLRVVDTQGRVGARIRHTAVQRELTILPGEALQASASITANGINARGVVETRRVQQALVDVLFTIRTGEAEWTLATIVSAWQLDAATACTWLRCARTCECLTSLSVVTFIKSFLILLKEKEKKKGRKKRQ